MIILGIDTSCDETALALLKAEKSKFEILSNVISSQVKLHSKYGGVYPSLAKREHQKNLPAVFEKTVKGFKKSDIDLVGFTYGPGLEPCLWQGINFSEDLVGKLKKPFVPVNHVEAHILANLAEHDLSEIRFPAVCLVVSGGHTTLFLMEKVGQYKIIGETLDDAAGEAFDKVARILGLGYPGGPVISKEAAKFDPKKSQFSVSLPRPIIYQKNYNFSFSGLKTAVLYNYKSQNAKTQKNKDYVRTVAHETQQSIIDVLLRKTVMAARNFKVRTVLLGGGVASNHELRRQFKEKLEGEGVQMFVPSNAFCTDNGVMIAITAYLHRSEKINNFKNIEAKGNLAI